MKNECNTNTIDAKGKLNLLPSAVALGTCGLQVVMFLNQFQFANTAEFIANVIPQNWFFLRQIVGAVFTILGPWGGWIFIFPYGIALFIRWKSFHIALLLASCAVLVGTANAYFSFSIFSLTHVAGSVATYLFIFILAAAAISPPILLIRRRT